MTSPTISRPAKQEAEPQTPNNINALNNNKSKHPKRVVDSIDPDTWTKCKKEYIDYPDVTLHELSFKYKIKYSTLKDRKSKEDWGKYREKTIKPIVDLRDDKLADEALNDVRLTIKRTALEALQTILGVMRGTISKNAAIRASTAQDMLDRAGFKQPDNIGQKLQAYTDLVKSITVNIGTVVNNQGQSVGTVVNNPKEQPNIIQDIPAIEAKVVENKTLIESGENAICSPSGDNKKNGGTSDDMPKMSETIQDNDSGRDVLQSQVPEGTERDKQGIINNENNSGGLGKDTGQCTEAGQLHVSDMPQERDKVAMPPHNTVENEPGQQREQPDNLMPEVPRKGREEVLQQPLARSNQIDTPTEQGLTSVPEITDSSDTEGTLSTAPGQATQKDSAESRYEGGGPL